MRQFSEELRIIPQDSPNFPYIQKVYVSPDNLQPRVKEGVINRFWKKMEAIFKNQNALSPRNNTRNQPIITGEIVSSSPSDSHDHRLNRRSELEQLKQDLDNGFILPEEYEREKQRNLLQYPL